MDWINKIHMIIEKMKTQMKARGVDSLEKVFFAISNYDLENKGYVDKIFFEEFLAKIGIFLKTQEINELHKYLYTLENGNKISYENFINILKCEIPDNILNSIIKIFRSLTNSDYVSIETLRKSLRVDQHPNVKLMIKTPENIAKEFDFAIMFVAGDKDSLSIDDFLEMHKNMYWVQPKENLNNYINMINALWGMK